MLNRINFLKIIKDHFKTLNSINNKTGKITISDTLLFLILPISISIYLSTISLDLKPHLSDLITAISIFGGFLFNLLAIIYGLMDKLQVDLMRDSSPIRDLKKTFIKQIHVNISFNILLSIFLILVLIIYPYVYYLHQWINLSFNFLIFFLLILFLLTLLMVLNRIYIILKKDIV